MHTNGEDARNSGATDVPRSLVFLHLPKTGGSTFSAIAARHFPKRASYHVEGLGPGLEEVRNALQERHAQAGGSPVYVHGHIPYGVHELLPQPIDYVTLMRDPVDRIVSVYYFAKRRPEWPQHRDITSRNLSLREFVSDDVSAEFHNQQSRMLAGVSAPRCEESLMQAAKSNLNLFRIAGPTNRFDEVLMLCRRLLGWNRLHYVRRNVNRRRLKLDQVSPADIAAIEAKNAADLELYEFVRKRLDAQIEDLAGFACEVRRFRRRNVIYELTRPISNTLVWLKGRSHRPSRSDAS